MLKSQIEVGHAATVLRNLRSQERKFHSCITSPPYYKQRDYLHENQIGQENTPQEYIKNLVRVFHLVYDCLHEEGTLWINIGDTYANKQLLGIPWMLAFALQADGWMLQQGNIWHKPNAMTGGSPKRFIDAHEYLFVFSKHKDYYFDRFAAQEPGVTTETRNRRSVISIPTKSSKLNHFALMPPDLAELCVLVSTSTRCCEQCLIQSTRVLKKTRIATRPGAKTKTTGNAKREGNRDPQRHITKYKMVGWEPQCRCAAEKLQPIVLDPFSGMATTGVAAVKHCRRYLGIEINPETAAASRVVLNKAQSNLGV